MLLALDVGNTNTVLGLYRLEGEKPALAAHWRVTTHRSQTPDEYGVLFVNLFKMHGYVEDEVPEVTPELAAKKDEAEVLTSSLVARYFDVLDDVERQSLADGAKAMFDALAEPVAVTG